MYNSYKLWKRLHNKLFCLCREVKALERWCGILIYLPGWPDTTKTKIYGMWNARARVCLVWANLNTVLEIRNPIVQWTHFRYCLRLRLEHCTDEKDAFFPFLFLFFFLSFFITEKDNLLQPLDSSYLQQN